MVWQETRTIATPDPSSYGVGMRQMLGIGCAALAAAGTLASGPAGPASDEPARPVAVSAQAARRPPLTGVTIVLDPGHQLGNHNFPRKIARLVPAGGFRKPCNTTGTATNGGYPEATFVFDVARRMERRLTRLGARVVMTRTTNRQDRWGPCVDVRGRRGNAIHADLKISIHGDGHIGGHGFHVIYPPDRRPWTHDIFGPSRRLAHRVKAALLRRHLPVADYIAGGDGLDVRSDLATLNLSNIPTVMVELGNMRSRVDAARMTSTKGRATYAAGLVTAARSWLRR